MGWEIVANAQSLGGGKLLGDRPQVRLSAEARAELALAESQGSQSLLGEAGRKALDALLRGEVAGDWLALRERQRRALEIRPALPDTVRYGNAAGAIVAGRMMCADDMPTGPEVDEFLQERDPR